MQSKITSILTRTIPCCSKPQTVRLKPLELDPPPALPRAGGVPAGGTLAVRFPNHLGDAVMALPAVLQLRGRFSRIVAVAPPAVAGLTALTDIIDQTVTLSSPHRKWTNEDIENLAAVKADCGLLFNNSLRDAWYFRRAGVFPRYGAAARCRSFLLNFPFVFPKRRKGVVSHMHQARVYAAMAEALGGLPWTGEMPKFQVSPEPGRADTLVLAPGAAYGAAKRWPSAGFALVAGRYLSGGETRRVAIVGGASEVRIAEEVAAHLPPEQVDNLCGKTDLAALASLLAGARACIANDSGVMHFAAALGLPGVAVFGSTDATATFPVATNWSGVTADLPCSPCLHRRCLRHRVPHCMNEVPPEAVISELEAILKAQ
ncbi:MAG: lipopolysaccharide heptosyltransferase II [Victivallaceae bacterium]|nr:lipopolysaccharide heptosyltransferase II [Victivallaceae bacterium]